MKKNLPAYGRGRPGAKARLLAETGFRSRMWQRAVLCAAGFLIPCLLAAQGVHLDWSEVAAGGGTSGSGDYILSATVGQPFGGGTYSANYGMETGLEGLFENLESAAPPSLRIARADANSLAVFWPATFTGWVLQQASSPDAAADWTDVSIRVVLSGTDNEVMLPLEAGNRFYRLRHP
jgi:hypothetical protein